MGTERERDAIALLARALTEVGLEPTGEQETAGAGADLVVRGGHGVEFAVVVTWRTLVREGDVPAITGGITDADHRCGLVGVIVADRITE